MISDVMVLRFRAAASSILLLRSSGNRNLKWMSSLAMGGQMTQNIIDGYAARVPHQCHTGATMALCRAGGYDG